MTTKAEVDTSAITGFFTGETKPPAPTQAMGFEGVTEGKVFSPPRLLVYGLDGSGKSTFAAGAIKPIFIQTEKGLDQLGPARFPLARSLDAVIQQLNTVATQPHDYQTLVIDSVTGLEKLIFEKVCQNANKRSITEVGGGFRRGETAAMATWVEIIQLLERVSDRGIAVILIGHQGKEDAGNPEYPTLKVTGPLLDKAASAYLRQWVDATLFITRRIAVSTVGQGIMEKPIAKPVGSDGGERIMICNGSPMLHAKNRYGIPSEIPFPKQGAWDLFMQYVVAFFKKEGE